SNPPRSASICGATRLMASLGSATGSARSTPPTSRRPHGSTHTSINRRMFTTTSWKWRLSSVPLALLWALPGFLLFFDLRERQRAWSSSPLASAPCSSSRSTPRSRPFYSDVWRAMLLVAGAWWAFTSAIADFHYTRGGNALVYADLRYAADLFPWNHDYRMG